MTDKNEVYKEYLTSKMHESDLIIKLDSIQEKTIKDDGVIYTPWNIVQDMILIAEPSNDMHIIEPSCGHGIFLIGLLYYMTGKHNLEGKELFSWFKNKVVGVEISQNTVNELKEILSVYFLKHFKLSIEPNEFSNIYCHDGLTFDDGRHFDLCIGNPPYIRAKNLNPDYLQFLKKTYKFCKKGTIDIYFAFIEKYSNQVDQLVFITPNSFLSSKSGLPLKNELIKKLTFLIDFKDKKVFKDASVYTCIFKTVSNKVNDEIFYGHDIAQISLKNKLDIFENTDKSNNSIDSILSGIATLCDRVFIVKKGKDNKFYSTYNNNIYEIEKEIVVPYLKLTKIKSDQDLLNIDYMIYPYNENKKIIPENELQEKFPLAYRYLLLSKEILLQRDKGKTDKYESWYAYGRKQGLHQIKEKDVITVPQMIGGQCLPKKIDITNILNDFGKFVFTSGFIIPFNNKTKTICESILTENFINFAKRNGKAWPGKDESYYSLTIKQIKRFNP